MDAKGDKEKKMILEELIVTAQRHADKLVLMRRLETLVEGAGLLIKPSLSEADLHKIFPPFETIASFHQGAILPGLKQCYDNWAANPYIGPLVKGIATTSKCYVDYIPHYKDAMAHLEKLKSQSSVFAHMITDIEKKKEFGGLAIKDHLLDPLHHLTRYNTLLERFAKYCSGSEHADIVETVHAIADTIGHCERNIKMNSEFVQLCEVQKLLTLNISRPNRKLVYRGDVTEVEPTLDAKTSIKHLILFNDLILVCHPLNKMGKLVVKDEIDLDVLRMEPPHHLATVAYDQRLVIHVRTTPRTLTLLLTTSKSKAQWEKAFQIVAKDIPDVAHSPVTCDFSEAPTMQPGSAAEGYCMMCSAKFTNFKTKKSCEACGKVVCGNCSSHKIQLPYSNRRSGKVCSRCFVRGTDMGLMARSRAGSQISSVSAGEVTEKSPPGAKNQTLQRHRPNTIAGPPVKTQLSVRRTYCYCIWEPPARNLREWKSTKGPTQLLENETNQDSFLVHRHESEDKTFLLYVKHNQTIMEFTIDCKDGKYGANERQRFHTMSDVIEFYRKQPVVNGAEGKVYLLRPISEKEHTRI